MRCALPRRGLRSMPSCGSPIASYRATPASAAVTSPSSRPAKAKRCCGRTGPSATAMGLRRSWTSTSDRFLGWQRTSRLSATSLWHVAAGGRVGGCVGGHRDAGAADEQLNRGTVCRRRGGRRACVVARARRPQRERETPWRSDIVHAAHSCSGSAPCASHRRRFPICADRATIRRVTRIGRPLRRP